MVRGGKRSPKKIELVTKWSGPRTNPAKGKVVLQPIGRRGNARRVAAAAGMSQRRGGRERTRFVTAPVARARVATTQAPKIGNTKTVPVKHSEYLGEIQGSVGFNVHQYPINPGLALSFPWLSNIAAQYEEYRVKRLNYRFETEAPTSTKGSVVLVTDVDALDSAFQSKQQAMDYRGASRTAPWQRVVHNAQAAARSPYGARFVRSGTVPTGGDLKTYDAGLFQLITQGMADTAIIGELYVDYEFEFISPKVNNVIGQNLLGADIRGGGTINVANPLGSAPTQVDGSNITVNVNGQSLTLENFSGRVFVLYSATGTGITGITVNGSGGATDVTVYGVIFTATACMYACSIDLIANNGQGITIVPTATTLTAPALFLQQMSAGLLLSKKEKKSTSLPIWAPPDPLVERIAMLERALVRARIVEDSAPPPIPSVSFSPKTGMTGF